jgi:glycosyltransferase involved in cell wall biosynthesis
LYPIVDPAHADFAKENLIVTLGRFAVSGVSKRQDELARAFSTAAGLADWRLACLGEAKTEEELRYVAKVRSRGKNLEVRVGASREEVLNYLGRARIFWHAAGLFEDEDQRPERLEHFGISTVEAMISGCVPVVIGLGGQAEIVQHGQNGFLCQSLEEMIERSQELAARPELCERMSHAARIRAQAFSRAAVGKRLRQLAPFV